MNPSLSDPSSYRDPAGFVFKRDGVIYRQINQAGKADFTHFIDSGLYTALTDQRLLVAHQAAKIQPKKKDHTAWQIIQPELIPFISYPYEWSFDQLKDAALLTLRVQREALAHGMILKDASTYNIQFIGKQAIFIDTLSFATYKAGHAWEGYKQFCEHFLAPLAIAHYTDVSALRMLLGFSEGIPLFLATRLLPARARYKKGLGAHLYLHASSQRRHQNRASNVSTTNAKQVSDFALKGLMHSLEATIRGLKPPKQTSEWNNYYEFTNYSEGAFDAKRKIVNQYLDKIGKVSMVWDLGANDGTFSTLAAVRGSYTVAWDIDSNAVNTNYQSKDKQTDSVLLPLVQDLAAPSPGLGWGGSERQSFLERGPADVVLALALVHHLAIGRNVPLEQIAALLAQTGKHIIIEFVPKADSKVQILLSSRQDIFDLYDEKHFEIAMAQHFKLIDKKAVKDSKRSVYLYEAS